MSLENDFLRFGAAVVENAPEPPRNDGFPAPYRGFIHKSKYARWIEEESRREEWIETTRRYIDYIADYVLRKHDYEIPEDLMIQLFEGIYNHEIMPSMRALMTAGPALERDNVSAYNCSYVPIDSIVAFKEILYILSCGTGVGSSVEERYVSQLPEVPDRFRGSRHIIVPDSKYGWADSFHEVLDALYQGQIPSWDTSLVRPYGARLKTFGGRASGPEPLEDLFAFTLEIFLGARGRQLLPIEVADLLCKTGDVIVSGGVRRSSLIILTDLWDLMMSMFKTGTWFETHPHRALANVSVAYEGRPSPMDFSREWNTLVNSGSGERGIFNRRAAERQAQGMRRMTEFGTNPCSEIILRSMQFCNLSSVPVRPDDSFGTLIEKVQLATVLGTLQSTITDFHFIRDEWKRNTEEERLLGVSLSGQMSHPVLNGSRGMDELEDTLRTLRRVARDTNHHFADEIGIPRSTAITCVKPEGTSSQLVGTASGMHPWHSEYFIRTVRGGNDDPMTQFLIDKGVPHEPDLQKPEKRTVFSFPVKAPEGSITREDLTALEHLEIWKVYQDHWCEHKPSITVSVRSDEWDDVGTWVYEHFDEVSGIAFLPYEDHVYQQAPYQEINEAQYNNLMALMPDDVDYSELADYETEDNTEGSQTLSCSAGSCEIVDFSAT